MVNFGLLTAEIDPVVWGTPANFNGFRVLASSVTARQSSSERQPNLQHYLPTCPYNIVNFGLLSAEIVR